MPSILVPIFIPVVIPIATLTCPVHHHATQHSQSEESERLQEEGEVKCSPGAFKCIYVPLLLGPQEEQQQPLTHLNPWAVQHNVTLGE